MKTTLGISSAVKARLESIKHAVKTQTNESLTYDELLTILLDERVKEIKEKSKLSLEIK